MFKNCTIKYFKETNFSTGKKENVGIKVIHPESNGERKIQSVLIRSKDNTLYQDIMKWVAEGNTIEEAD
tara:strand:- start:28 stop:234 length:207 start_codon:yes stop_codon:yes gene_type:complete